MENNNKEEFNLNFPRVKKVHPKLIGNDLKPYNKEELKKELKRMFNSIEKLTGKKIKIIRNK